MPARGLHVRSSTAPGQSVESGRLHTHRLRLVHTPKQDSASDSSSVLPVEFLEAVKLRASTDRLTQTGTEYDRKVSSEAAVSLWPLRSRVHHAANANLAATALSTSTDTPVNRQIDVRRYVLLQESQIVVLSRPGVSIASAIAGVIDEARYNVSMRLSREGSKR